MQKLNNLICCLVPVVAFLLSITYLFRVDYPTVLVGGTYFFVFGSPGILLVLTCAVSNYAVANIRRLRQFGWAYSILAIFMIVFVPLYNLFSAKVMQRTGSALALMFGGPILELPAEIDQHLLVYYTSSLVLIPVIVINILGIITFWIRYARLRPHCGPRAS